MDYCEAQFGRIFVLRLHHSEVLHETIEKFASEKAIQNALCFFLGGAKDQSKVVVGPKDSDAMPPIPTVALLKGAHECVGIGTIFINEKSTPQLHMHASFGRNEKALTGCVRMGVDVWLIGEVVILELTGCGAKRIRDTRSGFEILETNP